MRIVILGAGQVGTSVAEALASEINDVTDRRPERSNALAKLADRLDVRTVTGNAALPSVLRSAGIEDAEMLVAVTQSDQTNLVACKIARHMFNVPTRVARLRGADFLGDEMLLGDDMFAVSHAMCPEQDITDYISRLVAFPEACRCSNSPTAGLPWSAYAPTKAACWSARTDSVHARAPARRYRRPHRRHLPRAPACRSHRQAPRSKPATKSSCSPPASTSGLCCANCGACRNRCGGS
jgi:hypothetical protein